MVARRGKRTVRRSTASKGGKLFPTIKKEGAFKGPGMFAAKQTGIKPLAKIVPAFLMIVALAAATPPLGRSIASSVATVPVIGQLTNTAVTYGSTLRAKIMPITAGFIEAPIEAVAQPIGQLGKDLTIPLLIGAAFLLLKK